MLCWGCKLWPVESHWSKKLFWFQRLGLSVPLLFMTRLHAFALLLLVPCPLDCQALGRGLSLPFCTSILWCCPPPHEHKLCLFCLTDLISLLIQSFPMPSRATVEPAPPPSPQPRLRMRALPSSTGGCCFLRFMSLNPSAGLTLLIT